MENRRYVSVERERKRKRNILFVEKERSRISGISRRCLEAPRKKISSDRTSKSTKLGIDAGVSRVTHQSAYRNILGSNG